MVGERWAAGGVRRGARGRRAGGGRARTAGGLASGEEVPDELQPPRDVDVMVGGLLLRLRAVARPLSRVGAVVGGACANAFRRRLIVVLGGSLEEGAKGL